VADPVTTRGGDTVYACGAAFDGIRGHYLGRVDPELVAVIGPGRGIRNDLGEGGVELVTLDRRATRIARDSGGLVASTAVSADGSRLATIEAGLGTGAEPAVVVRDARSLARIQRVALPRSRPGLVSAVIGFMREGRVVVGTADAAGMRIASIATIGANGLERVAVPSSLGRLRVAGFSADGTVAALALQDRRVALIAIPSGALLATSAAPRRGYRPDESARTAVAVAPRGARVAVRSDSMLLLYERDGSTLSLAYAQPDPEGPDASMVFDARGERLFLGGGELTALGRAALRDQASALPQAARVSAPRGFSPGRFAGGSVTFPSQPGTEWAREPGLVAAYIHAGEPYADLKVVVTDSQELALYRELERWGAAVMERYEPYTPLDTPSDRRHAAFRAFRDPRGRRAVEVHVRSDGCDPEDRWFRVTEDGKALVHVTLSTPVGARRATINAWRQTVFE